MRKSPVRYTAEAACVEPDNNGHKSCTFSTDSKSAGDVGGVITRYLWGHSGP